MCDKSYMAIAALVAFLGSAVFIATRSATFSMLPLSDQYAAAITEAQQFKVLAAGEAVGVQLQATPRTTGFLLIAVAVLIISLVMLRSRIFSNWTAYTGILASALVIALHLSAILLPAISGPLLGAGMLFWFAWLILVGRRLLQLGRDTSKEKK